MLRSSFRLWTGTVLFFMSLLACNWTATTDTPDVLPPTADQSLAPTAASPTPLPEATLILPLAVGIPLPHLNALISSDNSTGILEIARWAAHGSTVWSLTFSPDGKTLVSTSADGTTKVWDRASGSALRNLSYSSVAFHTTFSPDGKTLALTADNGPVTLWDLDSDTELRTLSEHTQLVFGVDFSPDGKTLAAQSETPDTHYLEFKYNVTLWDLDSRNELRTFSGHTDNVTGLEISPDGKTLATGSSGGWVSLWDISSGNELRRLMVDDFDDVAFSPDGSALAVRTATYDGSPAYPATVTLWDAASGSLLRTVSMAPDSARSMAFSPDGKTLALGLVDGSVILYDVASGNELRRLSGHSDIVYAVAISPDSEFIVSGSVDGTIRWWGIYP